MTSFFFFFSHIPIDFQIYNLISRKLTRVKNSKRIDHWDFPLHKYQYPFLNSISNLFLVRFSKTSKILFDSSSSVNHASSLNGPPQRFHQRDQAPIPTLSSSNIIQHVTHRSVNLSSDLRAPVLHDSSFHADPFPNSRLNRRLSSVCQFVNNHL